jgi:hypothetical protein
VTACWERSVRLGTAAAAAEVACWEDIMVGWVVGCGVSRESLCGRSRSPDCREG